jgi:molybdenum cofactor cytidylyltransferase
MIQLNPPDATPESFGATSPIGAIVLAAGRSSRMGGRHKLLLSLGDRPLVSYAVEAACASSADPVIVVLGYQAEQVRAVLSATGRFAVRVNPDFGSGMAGSLRLGIETLLALQGQGGRLAGVVVLLADQPLVGAALVDLLVANARATPAAIIAVAYAGQRSTPVYFPSYLFSELLQITGDEGGRSVIAGHPDLLRIVDIAQTYVGLDVDSSLDYQDLLASWNRYAHLRSQGQF